MRFHEREYPERFEALTACTMNGNSFGIAQALEPLSYQTEPVNPGPNIRTGKHDSKEPEL